MRLRMSKAQSELIAGVLILSVIFVAVIPLLLRIQTSVNQAQINNVYREEFLQIKREESLAVGGVPPTPPNLRANLVPGVWINNTGTVPVTLESLLLISKRTNNLTYFIDMKYLENNPVVSWALIYIGNSKIKLTPGTYPTLQPGASLLIRLDLSIDEAKNYVVKVVTSTGNVLPKQSTTLSNLVPPVTTYNTLSGGIYIPTSGFKLIGYNEIVKNSNVTLLRGSHTVDVTYTDSSLLYLLGYPYFNESFIWDDPTHPGFYMVTIKNNFTGYWDVYTGFLGTYQFYLGSFGIELFNKKIKIITCNVNYVNGFYTDKYSCNPSFNPESDIPSNRSGCSHVYSGALVDVGNSTGAIREEDTDHNGVPELVLDTVHNDNDWYETYALKVMISKDITDADFIKVSTKINYYWKLRYSGSVDLAGIRKLRIAMIAVYKLNVSTRKWVMVHYKDLIFSTAKPRTFILSAIFPVNRSDIYRVAVFLYDPYTEVVDPSDNGEGGLEFKVGLEYVFVEWGVNNPYLENLPTVYLLALNDGWGAEGVGNETDLQRLLSLVEDKLRSVGISNYIVIDNDNLTESLLIKNPPKNAIVINLHGMESPISNETVMDHVINDGWIWVNIVGDPPVHPSDVSVDTSINVTAGAGADWDDMVNTFNLYGLSESIWSNYSIKGASPTYVFYINASVGRVVSAAWAEGDGYIIINSLPPIDWTGKDPHASKPDTVATLAVFTALYVWLRAQSG